MTRDLPLSIETARCTGHCCRRFHLSNDFIDEITSPNKNPKRFADQEAIEDMVVFIEFTEHGGAFTCRHFDMESGQCTNYENRPAMCRDYPYGDHCTFEGCTRRSIDVPKVDRLLTCSPQSGDGE